MAWWTGQRPSGFAVSQLSALLFKDRLNIRASLKGSQTDDNITPGGVLSNSAQFGPTQPVLDENSTTGYYEWPNNALQSADNPAAILAYRRTTRRPTEAWERAGRVYDALLPRSVPT
jgi:hypothetical protein